MSSAGHSAEQKIANLFCLSISGFPSTDKESGAFTPKQDPKVAGYDKSFGLIYRIGITSHPSIQADFARKRFG
jgi:hypothetical protein